MGAWSRESFGNDAALDWSGELEISSDLALVEQTLQNVTGFGGQPLDAIVACEAVAACEVVARLRGRHGEQDAYSEAVDNWVQMQALVPGKALVDKAILALARIEAEPSELRTLWEESGELQEWIAAIDDLRNRLRAKPLRIKKSQPKAGKKKIDWKMLEKGNLFEILTHTGQSLMGQILSPGMVFHICVLDCSGEAYRTAPDVVHSAQTLFEGSVTDGEFVRGNWVLRGHAEARDFQRPYHVVDTNSGFVLRDFDRVVVRAATEKDEALYGFQTSFSGAVFTDAVSRYFVYGLDAIYGNIDVRRLREKSRLM